MSSFVEKFWMWLAFRMPKKLVYFCTIRLGAFVTQHEHSNTAVPELSLMDAIGSYGKEITWR